VKSERVKRLGEWE